MELDPEETAAGLIPPGAGLEELRKIASHCTACPLWERGTQTVFGEGLPDARLILVGEQPGDIEDRKGQPFVGPAGRVLDQALERAGIVRSDAYVTNVVKHFKWIALGKRRLHQKPNSREIGACLPWLDAEIALIKPLVLVAMGATAAQALFGSKVQVKRDHGRFLPTDRVPHAMVTTHPSAILRAPTDDERHYALDEFVADLRRVAAVLK
ncbi:UdgX family uracil-DNA binding protein [Geomesophilobacter sediminis]|uniref:Type-4 uracil-DNA glycosylase n=1 Tax=Geomesophilobacter sediminis TaxID=2798584 RepID=A0A8J7J8M0_9BACT|nr:UdgX family uracil-DNA binding protein [Geomesophilobacter sediminis]MBJ6725996.1 UdgX family uracil-DNA binding protein [Geomesophilobacter sediminis]